MAWLRVFVTGMACGAACASGVALSQGAASIEQVPTTMARQSSARLAPVNSTRAVATKQAVATDKIAMPLSPETLAACRAAQAADRPAPRGLDCVRALQATAEQEKQTAEVSLLDLFGQNTDKSAPLAGSEGRSVSAEQVSRQLSSGDFQGTAGSDAAASVARDRAPPQQTTPPPR